VRLGRRIPRIPDNSTTACLEGTIVQDKIKPREPKIIRRRIVPVPL
jgi:hypothetical protein